MYYVLLFLSVDLKQGCIYCMSAQTPTSPFSPPPPLPKFFFLFCMFFCFSCCFLLLIVGTGMFSLLPVVVSPRMLCASGPLFLLHICTMFWQWINCIWTQHHCCQPPPQGIGKMQTNFTSFVSVTFSGTLTLLLDVEMSIKSFGLCECDFSVNFNPNFLRDDKTGTRSLTCFCTHGAVGATNLSELTDYSHLLLPNHNP